MNTNSRFTVAIHIMTVLANYRDTRLTSEVIACSATTNPVVIRRIMGELRRAGLVESHSGIGGGWQLTKAPENITVYEVYHAVKEGPLFSMHHQQPNQECTIGRTIQKALVGIFADAEDALEQQFSKVTIADVLARVQVSGCPNEP